MNIEDAIYDVKTILTKSNVTDETRFEEKHILHKLNNYRSESIIESFDINGEIDTLWVQDCRERSLTKVNSADDLNVVASGLCFGKVTLPPVVALPEKIGIYRIASASSQKRFFRINQDELYLRITLNDPSLDRYIHFFNVEDSAYFYPYIDSIKPFLILEDPMDADIVTTEWISSGNLITGTSYTVYTNQISYNAVIYSPGDTFTAVIGVSIFTGNGQVKPTIDTLKRDIRRRYPCDRAMAQKIVWKILTQDFALEERKVADLINDSQDQMKLLSNENR